MVPQLSSGQGGYPPAPPAGVIVQDPGYGQKGGLYPGIETAQVGYSAPTGYPQQENPPQYFQQY